jgi:hypothetical protein
MNKLVVSISELGFIVAFASFFVFVVFSFEPTSTVTAQVTSHPYLFVSAENSQYNNYFAGPQVIQVVVSDPNINRLDQAYGEPVVTVDGKRLRMAQATDGNWYGYFADRNQAEFAAKTSAALGIGLNFGYFCGPTSTGTTNIKAGLNFTDTKGFTIARNVTTSSNGPLTITGATVGSSTPARATPAACAFPASTAYVGQTAEHVIRENKTLNTFPSGFAASTLYDAIWPIIQLYDFSSIPTPVEIDYQAPQGDQVVNLSFDKIPQSLISANPDRISYPENSQVFLTINDPQLNVDPTEEDVWTWGANATNSTLFYQDFNRNGAQDGDGKCITLANAIAGNTPPVTCGNVGATVAADQNLIGNLTSFNFVHNGQFTFNPKAQDTRIVDFQQYGKDEASCSAASPVCLTSTRGDPNQITDLGHNLSPESEMITFTEVGGVNTGVFGNWDGSKTSAIVTLNPVEENTFGTIRGQSATFNYNGVSGNIAAGFNFGTLTVYAINGTWPSGQRIPIILTDMNQNLNSKNTEHINDYDGDRLRITTMKIGTPFSLNSGCPTCFSGAIDPDVLLSHIPHQTINANGTYTLNLSGVANSIGQDNGIDEILSNRVVPQFVNKTGTLIQLDNNGGVLVDTGASMQTLLNTIHDARGTSAITNRFHGFNFLNFDLRSFTYLNGPPGSYSETYPSAVQISLLYSTNTPFVSPTTGKPSFINPANGQLAVGVKSIPLINDTNLEDFVNLNGTIPLPGDHHGGFYTPNVVANGTAVMNSIFNIPTNANIGFMYNFTTTISVLGTGKAPVSTNNIPMVTDFFSIGIIGDGTNNNQRINNAIYRWELEETGDNTGVFAGTTEFVMLNQINILNPATYTQLRTINHDVQFAAIQDMLQSEARAPQATYLDLGADGVNTQISAQQDITTHSGTVSFDQRIYKVGDTVTITVNDQDLDTNNDLVAVYTTVNPVLNNSGGIVQAGQDIATDTVGAARLGTYSNGSSIGRLLEVEFGQHDIRWTNAPIGGIVNTVSCFFSGGKAVNSANGTSGGFSTSLSSSGFSLVETAVGSGVFTGTFEVPDHVCQGTVNPVVTNGSSMKVDYVDFRDKSGNLVEVSDSASIKGNTSSVIGSPSPQVPEFPLGGMVLFIIISMAIYIAIKYRAIRIPYLYR